MSVTLRRIVEDDLEKIMNWRMDEDITRYMNTNPKLTLEGQKKWFTSMQKNPDVSYWMIMVDGQDAGVINLTGLTKEDGNLGWAYYMGEKRLRSLKTALALEMSLYDYIFDVLQKNALYSDVFTLNQGVIKLHLLCGCEIVEEKEDIQIIEGMIDKMGLKQLVSTLKDIKDIHRSIEGGEESSGEDAGVIVLSEVNDEADGEEYEED